ncbi:MAG: GNAT family N-acetyltransferase [Pseudomonadota bacterium]|nr:GNAT family N-acetyltransferase [Pseudomonadota bacterium]
MQLVWPELLHLPSYTAALEAGWSADHVRGVAAAKEERVRIKEDPKLFIASLIDREAKGDPVELPDGSTAKRIPGLRRWMWDGDFCGVISFRWQPGSEALPPHCLGHIGYAVVPNKRNRGFATEALRATLPLARAEGLRYVEVTTDPDNLASQRTIEKAGGVLYERFTKPSQFSGKPGLRYRIELA